MIIDRSADLVVPPLLTIAPMEAPDATWPPLPLAAWADTCATLHMWTQIVGKTK